MSSKDSRSSRGEPLVVEESPSAQIDGASGADARSSTWTLRRSISEISRLALPNIASQIMSFVNELTNTIFVGQTGNDAELAAVGLGNMVQNCMGLSIGFGICAALDTFVSQAHGAGQPGKCVSYLQRCRVLVTLQLLWMAPLLWFSEDLLLAIHQDKEVAYHAGTYNKTALFGLFGIFQFEASRKYLQNQERTLAPAIIASACSVLHVLWCWIFIGHLRLGNRGAGLANVMTWSLQCFLAYAYLLYVCPQLTSRPRLDVVCLGADAFRGLRDFIAVAFAATSAVVSEWWFWEICALFAGYLGPTALAAHVTTLNTVAMTFMIPLGFSASAATLVGNSIGAGDTKKAKRYYGLCVLLNLLSWLILASFLFFGGELVAEAYTHDEDVRDIMVILLRIFAVAGFFDSTQNVMSGVMRGIGWQTTAASLYVVFYYVIMLPLGVVLAFPLRLGVEGIWYSMLAGTGLATGAFALILRRVDWDFLCAEARARLARSTSPG